MICTKTPWKPSQSRKTLLSLKTFFVILCICKTKSSLPPCFTHVMSWWSLMLHLRSLGDAIYKSTLCLTSFSLSKTSVQELRTSKRVLTILRRKKKLKLKKRWIDLLIWRWTLCSRASVAWEWVDPLQSCQLLVLCLEWGWEALCRPPSLAWAWEDSWLLLNPEWWDPQVCSENFKPISILLN
jgi:hypothetical protein